jgi:bifunctional non-homologous end joining protein LigD
MALNDYWRKRDFKKTKEPSGKAASRGKSARARKAKALSFVIQKHDASHLHYDFRLEFDGVLKSWSIPKGPSLDPADKRLAVEVEDHPLDYASFEGVIPAGEYGGGDVIVWDRGTWESEKDIKDSLKVGRLEFELKGEKLEGSWVLIRTGRPSKKPQWLLIKRHDEFAKVHEEYDVIAEHPESVKTGNLLPRDQGGVRESKKKTLKSARAPSQTKKDSKLTAARLKKLKTPSKKKDLKFPGFVEPQLAKLVTTPPEGDEWVHELKFDGYRAVITIDGKSTKFFTRAGNDWTDRYGSLVGELRKIKVTNAIIDSEIVALDEKDRPNFSILQDTLSDVLENRDQNKLICYAFDLLWLNGEDLRERPLLERKALLDEILSPLKSERIRYSEHWQQDGKAMLAASCKLDMEGIISKRVDATYESTRSGTWLKSKCSKGQEFIIGGYSSPKGSRSGFGALLLGAYDENNLLRYTGRVGTGFDQSLLDSVYQKLKKLKTATSPFEVAEPTDRDIAFVKPKLVCQIRFAEWTKDRMVRQAVFDGLRGDKDASLVKIEKAAPAKKATAAAASRVKLEKKQIRKGKTSKVRSVLTASAKSDNPFKLTHPDKVLYPDVGVTKEMMAEYYKLVQDRMLPHTKNRPLSLVRCPDGAGKECFFQKKLGMAKGKELHSQKLKGRDHEEEILTVDRVEGLYELVQMGVLEIHNWGCHVPKINKADLVVFDLDPDEGLDWQDVKAAAFQVKELLEELNLKTWVKTTGGKGLHIHVPVLPEHSFDDIKAFSLSVVHYLEKKHPDRYTSQAVKAKRKGRIFLDYLRNGYGATSVAPYSLRAKSRATIACPITWEELRRLKGADVFTIANIERRLRTGKDPWLGYFRTRQRLDLRASDQD